MQIREKGNKVLLIRTEYIPEKKRTVGKTIASQKRSLSTVSEEVASVLTAEEVEQLELWLSERTKSKSVESANNSLYCATYSIKRIGDAVKSEGTTELSDE
jgi:uncharacterized protein YwgA